MLRKIVVFLVYIFNLVVFRVEKNGEENIKEKGAYLICANHRSNWDAPILVIFPEGTRNGMEKNGKAQNGVAYMAIRTGVPVIPVGIQGEMKPFKKVKLNIGEPLDFSQYKTNKPEKEILDKVSKEIMDNIIMLTNEKK